MAMRKNCNKEKMNSPLSPSKSVGRRTKGAVTRKVEEDDESPFFGFNNSDIPQPIVIKTEPVEDGDSEDCVVVEVTKASEPLPVIKIKKEKEDYDHDDTFHGFSLADLPKPILIKEETNENEVSVERVGASTAVADSENNLSGFNTVLNSNSFSTEIAMKTIVSSPTIPLPSSHLQSPKLPNIRSPPGPFSPLAQVSAVKGSPSPSREIGKQPLIPQPKFITRPSNKNDPKPEPVPRINSTSKENVSLQQAPSPLPKKIQIIDANGEKIELITQEAEGDFDTEDETEEDHEFTVVVEENDAGEVTTITRDVHVNDKNVIEADSIEDIIAQFEHNESTSGSRSVSCPNCRKCFVSNHFLNLHISNVTTMCELCNTQCCSQVNLRNHKNLECDLSKRKRNIDLIAKETALLGRKPIEPEKYYNLPVEDMSDDEEERELEDEEEYCPSPPKKHKPEIDCIKPEEISDELIKLACGMAGCDLVFDNRGALKRHRAESHPELEEFKPVDLEPDDPDRAADMTVACPVCERKFKHKNTCTVHIKTNHLGWSKKKLFDCPECQRPFDNKKAVEAHRESVHLGIRTVCPLCDKPVTRLDLHVRMVHTDLPEWPCPDCGKKFKRKFDLNRHRVTVHLGVRNFPCDLCGKRFADMKDMNRHKNAVHYGMKIKWNSRKYKEKKGTAKPKKSKAEPLPESNNLRKKNSQQQVKLEETSVTYIETVETSGEEIISMEGLEGSTVILENGTVLQSHLEAVKGAPGEPQVFIEADPDGHGAYRFVVMTEEEAGTVLEPAESVEVQ